MASMVNVHEAKTHLSKLLSRVEQGEEVIIAKAGRPLARLVPIDRPKKPRSPGSGKGGILYMAEDFNAPLPEELLKDFGA